MIPEQSKPDLGLRVSYAQNGEDIVLARGLRHNDGFYVDVGAFDPDVDSVTKLFYQRGWSGINVDPVPEVIERFRRQRPRDVNVQIAVSVVPGEAELWTGPIGLVGHSTLDATIANAHISDGVEFTRSVVRTMRLDDLLDTWVPPGTTIDFLKVDVEGHEQAVLESCDWSRWRPRVVVVECVVPYVDASTHDQWEHILLANDYKVTLFDGLNRFYVAAGETDLADALRAPASVVDRFERAAVHELNNAFLDVTTRIVELDQEAATERAGRLRAESEAANFRRKAADVSELLAENIEQQRALTVELDRREMVLDREQLRFAELTSQLEEITTQAARLQAELTAIQRTKVFRYSAFPRRLYARLLKR